MIRLACRITTLKYRAENGPQEEGAGGKQIRFPTTL